MVGLRLGFLLLSQAKTQPAVWLRACYPTPLSLRNLGFPSLQGYTLYSRYHPALTLCGISLSTQEPTSRQTEVGSLCQSLVPGGQFWSHQATVGKASTRQLASAFSSLFLLPLPPLWSRDQVELKAHFEDEEAAAAWDWGPFLCFLG